MRLVLVLWVESGDPVVDVARNRLDDVAQKVLHAKRVWIAASMGAF